MMTTTGEKRLFIGGLVKGVTEEEIVEKFSRFGQVNGIEIKTRVSDTDSKTFAYLNLNAEENAFKKCFTAYNNTKWKGGQLKLQFAKENFLSKLKKEQAEAKTSGEKDKDESTSVRKNPALESDRKAVPGTPMDDNGTWVMGKYSRVLPVLNIRKPGTRKIVTVDPSKMSHCVKKLKADDYDVEKHSDLTWQLEETTSDINKRRQGQFPEMKASTYHSTPKEPTGGKQESIFSRLQGLAAEEQVSDTEMEVVPAGNTAAASKITVHNGYDSDDSASSADTDEIVFKASGKKASVFTAKKSKTVEQPKMKKKQSPQKDPDQFSDDLVFSSNLSTPFNKFIGKKTPENLRTNKESQAKNHKPEVKAVNKEESKAPQFQFVKAPELKGKALKKSAKLSQGKMTSVYEHSEHEDLVLKGPTIIDRRTSAKRTPEFKGLGMLSSDSEDDGLPTRQVTGPESNKHQGSGKETTIATTKCTRTPSSSSKKKKTQKDVRSDSEDTDNVLSRSKTQEKSVSKQSGEATKIKKSGLPSCDHDTSMLSHKPVKEKQTEALDSSEGFKPKDTQLSLCSPKERKKTVHRSDVMENVSPPVTAKTGSSAMKRKESVGQLHTKEDASEFDSGLLIDSSSFATPQKKQKKAQPVSSDDSDLDDNDFEKVGKKLAARALGKRQPGAGPVTDASFRSEDNPNKTRKRKLSQDEDGHLTSLQKSHQAYGKIQQEKKRKESLITKTLREGATESKHVKFSDSEEENKDVEMKPAKMTLFSDSDSDSDSESDIDFSLRPQFEGSKGKKLFEIQSRIMDKRFRFDEDFQSDSDGDEDSKMMEQESEDEMGMERRRNQEILEKVLGYKPRQRSRLVYEGMSKRRYNPDAAVDHVPEKKPEKRKKMERDEVKTAEPSDNEEQQQQNPRPDESKEDVDEDSSSDSEEETDHSVDGESGPENNDQDSEEESDSELTEQTIEPKDSSAECRKRDSRDESGRVSSAMQRESFKDLFSGGSAFTFFGTPDVEDMDESEPLTSSKEEKVEKEDMEDEEEEEEEEEKESEEEEDKESEEEESVLDKCRVSESDRLRPSLQPQPSFMVARDDPRLIAAVRFFKRPHAEEFEELSERWGDERQKIMQLVRDRHKKACRKERQMKQGMKSRPFVKTKMRTSAKGKKW